MYIIKLTIFVVFTIIIALVYLPILIILYPWQRAIGPLLLQYASKLILRIFRVSIICADKMDISKMKIKGIILIPNHVTLLDIFLLSALYRTVYVSKIEVKYYPLFGQIASLIGIIFLRRKSPEDRHKIIRTIANKSQGRIITIFPQGTTSSIADPLPFKCGIFKIIEINREIVLLPVTIHYKEDKEIAWTKDILLENAKKVCAQKQIHVKVKVHKQISIDDYCDKTISEICAMAQKSVLSRLWTDY